MKFLKLNLLLAIGLSWCLASCTRSESVNVNQDSIYTSYRVVYEADDDKSYARATFRFGGAGGTLLELSDPAEVLVNNDPMAWRPLLAYYEKDFAGAQVVASFTYTDLDGNTFSNRATLADSIAFVPGIDTVDQSAAFTLEWLGAPLGVGEIVSVTISRGLGEDETKVFSTIVPGSNEIVLEQDRLAEIPGGEASIFIERRKDQELSQGTGEGGILFSRYVGPSQKVWLQ